MDTASNERKLAVRRWVWPVVAGAFLLYVVVLVVALIRGGDAISTAVIAVGGTAVGAAAGLVGSLLGARTQAASAYETAKLQANSSVSMKKEELANARSQLILEEALRWTEKAYTDLRDFLGQSRELGTSIRGYRTYDDVIVELQKIDTFADLLVANPLIRTDEDIVKRLRDYISALSTSTHREWTSAQRGGGLSGPEEGEIPVGIQGRQLAEAVGARLTKITASVGLLGDMAPDQPQQGETAPP
jgi:hypothetical protein